MSSKAPSGGTKEMVRSFSNRDRRTHWWNFTSSRSTALELDPKFIGQSVEIKRSPRSKGRVQKVTDRCTYFLCFQRGPCRWVRAVALAYRSAQHASWSRHISHSAGYSPWHSPDRHTDKWTHYIHIYKLRDVGTLLLSVNTQQSAYQQVDRFHHI